MKKKLSYKSSGVDIQKANQFVDGIAKLAASTMNSSVLKRKGAFGALFSFDFSKYKKPVLVSSTDGVGTKLLLANFLHKHDTVGIDLVAMNVNDILCVGARPLFFLDYIACGKLKPVVLNAVMAGIVKGCELAGCSLIGGETAEMPGMYKEDDYDLAGFTVGVVEEDNILDGSTIEPGDRIIGLASSGIHSNGFSLVRKVLSKSDQKKYAKEILEPTRIYVRSVLKLLENFTVNPSAPLIDLLSTKEKGKVNKVNGIAHITGGAFYEKLTKILPDGKCFEVDTRSWPLPEIFQLIQKKGKISDKDMFTTFNMGIGMALVVASHDVKEVRRFLEKENLEHWEIGKVIEDRKAKLKLI